MVIAQNLLSHKEEIVSVTFTQNAKLTSHPPVHPLWHAAAYEIKEAGRKKEMADEGEKGGGAPPSTPSSSLSLPQQKTLIWS